MTEKKKNDAEHDAAAYLRPPEVSDRPGPGHRAPDRLFQGIPSLACTAGGRLFATWYGGRTPGEDHNNYVILAAGDGAGERWSDELLVIDPDGPGPVRAFDPEIWLAPDGRLWLFWAQGFGQPGHDKRSTRSGVWAMTSADPESPRPAWSAPRRLCDGVMMCKPLVLSSGEWCLPVSRWHQREESASLVVSEDGGERWVTRGAVDVPAEVRSHDEHMVVEKEDGTLWMLVRTRYGIGESFSPDRGRSWSALAPAPFGHPCSRFFIRRLASGALLLVRHDPGPGGFADGENKGVRSHLAAFLSRDDGHSWHGRLMLDERIGVSYPDGDQAPGGAIYVVYDFDRRGAREILLARFGEADVERGAPVTEHARLEMPVNRAG